MDALQQRFAALFPDIKFPPPMPTKGSIEEANIRLRYLFTQDAEGKPCLDVYTSGRMGGLHLRLLHNGDTEALDTYQEGFSYDPNTPGDEERAKQEYRAHNERVGRLLIEKFY